MPFKRRFKDKYADSSPENASVVRTLFDLFYSGPLCLVVADLRVFEGGGEEALMRIAPEGAAFLAQTVFRLPRASLRVLFVRIAVGEIVLVEASVVAPI